MNNTEESWKRHYARIARKDRVIHPSNVFVGFNANIDAIIYIDETFEKILAENNITKDNLLKKEPKNINTQKEFLQVLAKSIMDSKEMELAANNKKLTQWIENTFNICEYRIGGQAGIMSKFLDNLGLRVVFSTPKLSEKMALLLPKTLIVPNTDGLKKLKDAKKTEETKTNYIFEYKKGTSLFNKKTPRADRFILATRPKGLEPRFHNNATYEFLSFFELVDRAIISGFQALGAHDKNDFEKAHKQIEKIKKVNPELKIHVEEAYVTDRQVSDEILDFVVRHVHSMGLNEVELAKTLSATGKSKKASAIEKSSYSLLECYMGAKELFEKMKLQRLHMHTYNYCMVLLSKDYGTSPEKMRDGLLFALLCAAVKASNGSVGSITDIKKVKTELNEQGIKELTRTRKELGLCDGFLETGICDMGDHFLIAVPTKISKKLKSTVGLGDVVSSSAFVYDVL